MSLEDKYFPFKKEFSDIVEGFGYHSEIKGKNITLDLKRKNSISKQVSAPLEKIFERFDNPKRSKKFHRYLEKIEVTYSALKGPFTKEVLADIFLLGAFGYLSIQFITRFHNLLAVSLVMVSIGLLLKALICSIFNILKSDSALLENYYGFKKFGNMLRADKYTFIKKIEHSKRMMVLYSAIFLLLSFSVYLAPSPLLIYTSEYVNVVTFFLAIILGTIQFLRNVLIHKDPVKAYSNLLLAVIFLILLISYAESLLQTNSNLVTIIGVILDLFVIFLVYGFVRDLINIRNLHHWVMSES
jgi:hypothetical protein